MENNGNCVHTRPGLQPKHLVLCLGSHLLPFPLPLLSSPPKAGAALNPVLKVQAGQKSLDLAPVHGLGVRR